MFLTYRKGGEYIEFMLHIHLAVKIRISKSTIKYDKTAKKNIKELPCKRRRVKYFATRKEPNHRMRREY